MAKKIRALTAKPAAAAPAETATPVAAKPKKRAAGKLTLTLPLSRARKLSGDLYETAGLKFWAEALDAATPEAREYLVRLQDAICDAGDLLKTAKANNPKRLALFMVACFERDGAPSTPPMFVTAASEADALALWKETTTGKYGRRKPRAERVPDLGDTPGVHS